MTVKNPVSQGVEDRIGMFRKIVREKQWAHVDKYKVDLFTASAIVSVYDALSDANKEKFGRMSVPRMQSIALDLIQRKNPLNRKEAADLLWDARRQAGYAKTAETESGRSYLRGIADGLAKAVGRYGPRHRGESTSPVQRIFDRTYAARNPGVDVKSAWIVPQLETFGGKKGWVVWLEGTDGPTIYKLIEKAAGEWGLGRFDDAPFAHPVAQQFSHLSTEIKRHIRAQQRGVQMNPIGLSPKEQSERDALVRLIASRWTKEDARNAANWGISDEDRRRVSEHIRRRGFAIPFPTAIAALQDYASRRRRRGPKPSTVQARRMMKNPRPAQTIMAKIFRHYVSLGKEESSKGVPYVTKRVRLMELQGKIDGLWSVLLPSERREYVKLYGPQPSSEENPPGLDSEINLLFKKLDEMKGTQAEGSREYMEILRKLQELTRKRLSGMKIAVPRRNPTALSMETGDYVRGSSVMIRPALGRSAMRMRYVKPGSLKAHSVTASAAVAYDNSPARCNPATCGNPRHRHGARRNPLLQTVMLAGLNPPRSGYSIAFNVYLNGKLIDTVFYSASAKVDADEVRRSLINHDGYDSGIKVVRSRGKRNPLARQEAATVARAIRSHSKAAIRDWDYEPLEAAHHKGAADALRGTHVFIGGRKTQDQFNRVANREVTKLGKRMHLRIGPPSYVGVEHPGWSLRRKRHGVVQNPASQGIPFREGQRIPVDKARAWVVSTGNAELLKQFDQAYKLQVKANCAPKFVTWRTIPIGSKSKVEMVTALVHYGDSPETYYVPPKGSKKGRVLYRHEWESGKKSVPLLASPSGKALLMPLSGKQVVGDWLRH
jgi:hypothetical protein